MADPKTDNDFEFSDGAMDAADRILLFGAPMVGKTTFASQFPNAVFLDAEDGTKKLNVTRILRRGKSIFDPDDDAGNWARALSAVQWVSRGKHPHKTLVIDTIDKLEHYAECHVMKHVGMKERGSQKQVEAQSIEDVGGGFQKGDKAVAEQFRKLISALDGCTRRGITVVLLAHEHVATVKTPNNQDYPRYAMQLSKRVSEILHREMDYVLHAMPHTDVLMKTSFGSEKAYTRSTGVRYLHCGLDSTRATKCRLPLPARMVFDYPTFAEAMKRAGDPSFVRQSVEDKIDQVRAKPKADAMRASLVACGGHIEKMADLSGRIDEYLAQQEALAEQKAAAQAATADGAPAS